MKRIITRTVLWVLVILWMGMIYNFSAENADESLETSDSVVDVVIERLFNSKKDPLNNTAFDDFKMKVSHFVRKSAHFTAYMILGILTSSALLTHNFKKTTKSILSLGICFLYAVSDEIHQEFVPGRAGRFSDVMIDTSGALLGVVLVLAAVSIVLRLRKKSHDSGEKI